MKKLKTLFAIILADCLLLSACYYGMGKEIERREAEEAYHVQQCETNPNYYPEFCKELMGE